MEELHGTDRRTRIAYWLGVLVVLSLMAALVLFVVVRTRLSPEERLLIGTWRTTGTYPYDSFIELHADRTANDNGQSLRWSVHEDQLVFQDASDVSASQLFWRRLRGLPPPGGHWLRIETLKPDRVVCITANGDTIVLKRLPQLNRSRAD